MCAHAHPLGPRCCIGWVYAIVSTPVALRLIPAAFPGAADRIPVAPEGARGACLLHLNAAVTVASMALGARLLWLGLCLRPRWLRLGFRFWLKFAATKLEGCLEDGGRDWLCVGVIKRGYPVAFAVVACLQNKRQLVHVHVKLEHDRKCTMHHMIRSGLDDSRTIDKRCSHLRRVLLSPIQGGTKHTVRQRTQPWQQELCTIVVPHRGETNNGAYGSSPSCIVQRSGPTLRRRPRLRLR